MNRINLIILLDKLESMIDKAPEIPLTGRVLLDSDEVFELLDKIRNAIPEEVKRAELVSSEQDRMISEGQKKAEHMIVEAKEYATRLVRESEITRLAQQEAKKTLEDAAHKAEQMQIGATDYANRILTNLETDLQKTLGIIVKGKDKLGKDLQEKSS